MLINAELGEEMNIDKDSYIRPYEKGSFRVSGSKKDKYHYKVHKKQNQWEVKLNADVFDFDDGDYVVQVSNKLGKMTKDK